MKISDEKLEELIDKVSVSSLPLYGLDALAAFRELQQYREERRWRTIDELSETTAPQFFQLSVSDAKTVNPMPFWLRDGVLCTWAEDQDGIGDVSVKMVQEWYTHWRPLPMDLPEGE